MNLGAARTALGDRGFDYLSTTSMDLMLTRALADIDDFWPWPWLHKTATGAAPLTISDLRYVLMVKDSSSNEMFGIDDREDVDIDLAGTPQAWWIDESSGTPTMKVWPVGTTTLTVRYVADSAVIVNSTDTPALPLRYHPLWIDLAVIRAYQDSDNFAAAQALQADVNQRLLSMVERYETRNRMNSPTMAIRVGSEDD